MNTSNITNYKPKDFAELLGVSVKTLQRWDRDGILKANRTPTDRRYYTYDQYLQFKGIQTENDIRERLRMKAVISVCKKEMSLFFAGYTDELTGKGLGSGALTGTNRIPELTEDEGEAKVLESWADTKRIVAEIIDAIRYKDIEKPNFITVHFLD